MRILLIHNRYQSRGGEDVVFEQEFTALSESCVVERLEFQNKKGIYGLFQFMLYPFNFLAAWKVWQKVRRFKPEIVHVHNTHYASGPVVLWIVQKMGIPVVQTLHNYRMLCPSALLLYKGELYTESIGKSFPWDAVRKGVLDDSRLKTFWTAFTYWLHGVLGTWKNIDLYFPITDFAKNLLLRTPYGISEEKIKVKSNFIIGSVARRQEMVSDNGFYLFVGRLSHEKGILPLLTVFEKLKLPLIIVGAGPLEDTVEFAAIQNTNIQYVGSKNKEQVLNLMMTAKTLVVPSLCYEGFPMVILEAFSLGLPVIVARLGAMKDIVEDKVNGFHIDTFDIKDFERRIMEVEEMPSAFLRKAGNSGYETFEASFTKDALVQKQIELYKSLLKGNCNLN